MYFRLSFCTCQIFFIFIFFLQVVECFELGRVAYSINDYYHANTWLNLSLAQVEKQIGKESEESQVENLNNLKVEILYYFSLTTENIGLQLQVNFI